MCVVLAVALTAIWPARRRLWRRGLWTVVALYIALSVPLVASLLVRCLPRVPAPSSSDLKSLNTLVVFDGDNRDGRIVETLNLARVVPVAKIWVLGREWMVDDLLQGGISATILTHEPATRTTREQTDWVKRLVATHKGHRIAVIASRVQMPRIVALFGERPAEVLFYSTPLDDEPAIAGIWRFVPDYGSLVASRDTIYELLALPYYRWRGWI